MDMLRWIGRLSVIKKRVQDAWMDLMPPYTRFSDAFMHDFAILQTTNREVDEGQAFSEWYEREKTGHSRSFLINDNLFRLDGVGASRLE